MKKSVKELTKEKEAAWEVYGEAKARFKAAKELFPWEAKMR